MEEWHLRSRRVGPLHQTLLHEAKVQWREDARPVEIDREPDASHPALLQQLDYPMCLPQQSDQVSLIPVSECVREAKQSSDLASLCFVTKQHKL